VGAIDGESIATNGRGTRRTGADQQGAKPMMRTTTLTGRRLSKRPKVAVVYEDVTAGFRLADWFARHGYQPTLTSAVHHLEGNLHELHPDVIVVGFSSAPMPLHSTVPRLRMTCPKVPIIAMVAQSPSTVRDASDVGVGHAVCADVFVCHSLDPPARRFDAPV
jgi:hypothetical protein